MDMDLMDISSPRENHYHTILTVRGQNTILDSSALLYASPDQKTDKENFMTVRVHPTADVSDKAQIGDGTSIWHHAQVREGVHVGTNCILGKGVYVDNDVSIGNNVKIQNYVSVYHGVTLEDGVFIGPHVCFTNDMNPRAINPDGSLKAADDWVLTRTLVKRGAALGANSTIRCGVTIGDWALVGSG
jgi:UDP-2-acetamido-3-amino-2,3-dideoxy-glucuronate N-acetyltransferase